MLATHADLARKLDALERKYDTQFKVVFDAIRQLMAEPAPTRRPIGFRWKADRFGKLTLGRSVGDDRHRRWAPRLERRGRAAKAKGAVE